MQSLNEGMERLDDMRSLHLAMGDWKSLNDEGIALLSSISKKSRLEEIEFNFSRTSLTNKALGTIGSWL